MLSSFMVKRKQEDIWGLGVPELKRGVAWVKIAWTLIRKFQKQLLDHRGEFRWKPALTCAEDAQQYDH